MMRLPKSGGQGQGSSPRRFHGWLATWLQQRRRGRQAVANAGQPLVVPPVTNLRLWLKPESLTEAAGDEVAQWLDVSPTENHLGAHAMVVAPIRSLDTYNGQRGVTLARLENGDEVVGGLMANAPVWSGNQPRSLYVVYVVNDDNGYGSYNPNEGQMYPCHIAGQSSPNAVLRWFVLMERPDVSAFGCPYCAGYSAPADFGFGATQVFGTPRLAVLTYDGANARGYCNQALNATVARNYNTGSAPLTLGCSYDGSEFFHGDVLEVLAYDAAHDDATRGAIENHLMAKYAIEA
jgi:hypothetical protein